MNIVVEKMYNINIMPMRLCGTRIKWCKSIKYLGVYLYIINSKPVKFDISPTKRNFHTVCSSTGGVQRYSN